MNYRRAGANGHLLVSAISIISTQGFFEDKLSGRTPFYNPIGMTCELPQIPSGNRRPQGTGASQPLWNKGTKDSESCGQVEYEGA